jgi:prephenate dehydrogenase
MQFEQITIVGVGLIGGSIGLAAKERALAGRIVGVGRDASNLVCARELGAIDSFTTNLAESVRSASLVVVCTPVDRIADIVLEAARHCRPGTILTDAGSTKREIVRVVHNEIVEDVFFVGSHPLAGSEKTGVEYARADMFRDRVTVVTPSSQTDKSACDKVVEFWKTLQSIVSILSPEEHDAAVAMTSHLPHALASAVAGCTPRAYLNLTAGGFRDVTRIAAGDPGLWVAIFLANREYVLSALDRFSNRLDEFKRLLAAGDSAGLMRWLAEGKQVRDAVGS